MSRPVRTTLFARRRTGLGVWGVTLLVSLLLNSGAALVVARFVADPAARGVVKQRRPERRIVLVDPPVKDPEVPEPPPPPEPPEPVYDGQIVAIAPPEVERVPRESDYLAEYDNTVPQETRTRRVEINPEVLAPSWSKEQSAESEAAEDVNVHEKSTGATVGNHRFDPDRDGTLASLPSPWDRTNKLGPQNPIPSSSKSASLSGAPQNDRLDEAVGDRVDLNTTKYPYASYMERIRRQVNYWWQQNLDNLSGSVRLGRSEYTSEVEVILNSDGGLEHIVVTDGSGVHELDDCVVRAFRLAAPFDNPPAGLVAPDGRVYLPEFDFTVQMSAARLQYQGVDPRAGVQFPGILKAPR